MRRTCTIHLLCALFLVAACAAPSVAGEDFYRPSGQYVCEGVYDDNGNLSWRTVIITVAEGNSLPDDAHPDAGLYVEGLNERNATYMTSSEQLVVIAPYDCLVNTGNARKFIGCSYVGIINIPAGTFVFYEGDYDEDRPFYWSQIEDGKVCEHRH